MSDTPQKYYPEEVPLIPITGWRVRNTNPNAQLPLFEDEDHARSFYKTRSHCTDCNGEAPTHYTVCDKCRAKRNVERYLELPEFEWNGEVPLTEFYSDRYFFDEDAVIEHAMDVAMAPSELMLVECEPEAKPEFPWEQFSEYDEEFTASRELEKKCLELLDAIHAELRQMWNGGKKRIKCEKLDALYWKAVDDFDKEERNPR